jgi:hypothetical protein
MIVKQYAEQSANTGAFPTLNAVVALREATAQKGAAATYATTHVAGLSEPSGMCMIAINYNTFCLYVTQDR